MSQRYTDYQSSWGQNYSYWQPDPIYDEVLHTRYSIPDKEHQVVIHQHGHVDVTDGSQGPHGDWYMYGKPKDG